MKKLIKHVKKWFEWATDPHNGNSLNVKILVLFGAPAPTFDLFIVRKERMAISISDYKKIKEARDKRREKNRGLWTPKNFK